MKTAKEILESFYREETIYITNKSSGKGDDPTQMMRWLSQDLKIIQSPDLPWGGEWLGHSGLRDWAAQMVSKFSHLEVLNPVIYEPSEMVDRSPNVELLMRCTLHLRVLGTDEDLKFPLVQIIKVNCEKEYIEEIMPLYWNVAGLNGAVRKADHIE